MKNRRQKQSQPKKVTLTSEENPMCLFIAPTNHKLIQEHTKKSSNHTFHSKKAGHSTVNGKQKNTKDLNPTSKQNSLSTTKGYSASKRGQKFKAMQQTFKKQGQCQNKNKDKYRQYCVVDEKFVPITNIEEQKLFDQFLSRTAANTNDFNYFQNVRKTTLKDDSRIKLKKVSINNEKDKDSITKQDKATSSLEKKSFKTVEIEVKAECTQIGMQYSQRRLIQQQKIETNIPYLRQNEDNQAQSLTDLLFRLQFGHLGNQAAFQNLSAHEKEHFSQFLETLIVKLKPEAKEKTKTVCPLSFDSLEGAKIKEENYQQEHKQQRKQEENDSAHVPFINYDNLQNLINLREYRQMSWIEDPTDYQIQDRVNTSLFSVVNFLCHFFCYIELQYTEQFLYMIKKMYGLTFKEKYRRISGQMPLTMEKKLLIIDESIFLDFIDENSQTICNANEIIHLRAIFDAFNEHLEQYRPFYFGNGQQFPWALQMFTTMSQYSIDEDSIQIIFRQAKEKIIEWASTLCGLIVVHDQKIMLPNNPLEAKQYQKENILILSWLKEQNFEKDEVQNYSTRILHQMAEDIYQYLIEEFTVESKTNFNN